MPVESTCRALTGNRVSAGTAENRKHDPSFTTHEISPVPPHQGHRVGNGSATLSLGVTSWAVVAIASGTGATPCPRTLPESLSQPIGAAIFAAEALH